MANISWKSGVSGNWNVPGNWSPGNVPGVNDDVSIPSEGSSYTVTINTAASVKSLMVSSQNGSHRSTVTLTAGNSLTTTGAIALNSNTLLDGAGTVTANGGITGSGTLQAGTSSSGGTLDVFGTIASGISFAIGTAAASTLKIEGTATASSAITINNNNQTLEIGPSGALTISVSESVTNGSIKLDGGSLTTSGLTLGSGSLTGHGTVFGAVNGPLFSTGGTITASGGTLEFKGAVDTATLTGATNFSISADGTLKFDAAVGTSSIKPTVTFNSPTGGVLDLSNASGESSNFHGTVSGFKSGDQIKFADNASGTLSYTPSTFANGVTTITVKDGSTVVGTVTLNGDYTKAHFGVSETGHVDTLTTDAACFMAGTMIRTPCGEVAVETLKRGDLVLSSDGHAKPISWLGVQTISTRFADKMRVWPIRIKAQALGENVPSRDLLLSPDHAVLVNGALIQAGALVNGTSIIRETNVPEVFTYYHVEVDDHSLILAENTPAETFVDNVDRLNFDNWAEHEALYPEGKPIIELPHPRAKSHRQVPVSTRVMLGARASAFGTTDNSAVA